MQMMKKAEKDLVESIKDSITKILIVKKRRVIMGMKIQKALSIYSDNYPEMLNLKMELQETDKIIKKMEKAVKKAKKMLREYLKLS